MSRRFTVRLLNVLKGKLKTYTHIRNKHNEHTIQEYTEQEQRGRSIDTNNKTEQPVSHETDTWADANKQCNRTTYREHDRDATTVTCLD